MLNNLLSLVIWVPILAGVAVLATGSERNAALARWMALAGALLGLIVALPLAAGFDTGRLHRAPARFDEAQLLHWQREAVRAGDAATLWSWMADTVGSVVPDADRIAFVEAVRGAFGGQ